MFFFLVLLKLILGVEACLLKFQLDLYFSKFDFNTGVAHCSHPRYFTTRQKRINYYRQSNSPLHLRHVLQNNEVVLYTHRHSVNYSDAQHIQQHTRDPLLSLCHTVRP